MASKQVNNSNFQRLLDEALAREKKVKNDVIIKARAKILTTSGMNKTETRYANMLDSMVYVGDIILYRFEAINFRLAPNTFYRPDFYIIFPCGRIELHEVKGFWREDARVKIKVAAEMYKEFIWKAVQYKKSQWIYENF
jgi:hypothetical protein